MPPYQTKISDVLEEITRLKRKTAFLEENARDCSLAPSNELRNLQLKIADIGLAVSHANIELAKLADAVYRF